MSPRKYVWTGLDPQQEESIARGRAQEEARTAVGRQMVTVQAAADAGLAELLAERNTETDLFATGAGSPEGSVTAAVGALYVQTDGVNGKTLWRKETGSGDTGWVLESGLVRYGAGSPESVVEASVGTVYIQTDGIDGKTLWRKETGSGNTGWKLESGIVRSGTGSPEAAVTATVGTIFVQTDGLYGKTLWVKRTGSGNTGWAKIKTDDGRLNVRDFGAKGDGVTDDTTAINLALASGPAIHFPFGDYVHTDQLVCVRSDAIDISADPGTIIRGVGSGFNSMWAGGVSTSYDPSTYGALVITGNPAAGDSTITVAGLNAEPGDILRLTSSDTWTVIARAGELVEVDSVAGDVYTLTRPLFGSYTGANTSVLKHDSPRVRIANLEFVRDSNDQGLVVKWARDLDLSNVRCRGARYAGIVTQFIYGGEIRNCSTRDIWYSGTGTSYGLEVSTSQHVEIHGNNLFGGRHAFTLGNYEPNRFLNIHDNTFANKPSETVGAFNIHSGAQHCTVHHNMIHGGVDCSAADIKFTSNTVLGGGAIQTAVFFLERTLCDYTVITDNEFKSVGGGFAVVHFRCDVNSATVALLRISRNQVIGQIDFAHGAIWISPFSPSKGHTLTISRFECNDNDVTALLGISNQAYALLINDNGGGDTYYPKIEQADIRGGNYYNGNGRAIGFINLNTSVARKNGDIALIGATLDGPSQNVYVDGARSFVGRDFMCKGGGSLYFLNVTALIDVRGRIFDALVKSGIESGGGNTGELILDNFYYNCKGVPSSSFGGWGRGSGDQSAKQVAETFNTVVPSDGTHRQGSRHWKTDVAAGGSPGWVCVSSGTFSAYSATGGTTTVGSPVITGLSTTTGLAQGDFVTVSAGFPTTGPFRVESVDSPSQVTIDTNADVAQSAANVTTPDPVFKTMAVVSA